MPVMPRRLDQEPTDVSITCFGDRSSTFGLAAGVLAGYESKVCHELTGGVKAPESVQLGHDADRGHGIDAPEAPQVGDGLSIRLAGGELAHLELELLEALAELIDG